MSVSTGLFAHPGHLLHSHPGDGIPGHKTVLLKTRERQMPGPWSSSGSNVGHKALAPYSLELTSPVRASPLSLQSWQALLPLLQWLRRTHGGVAHGWECSRSTLGGQRGSDSSLSTRSQARSGPLSTGPFSYLCPRLHPAAHSGLRICRRSPEWAQPLSTAPWSGCSSQGTGTHRHPQTPRAQSHAHPATEPCSPASCHAPSVPVTWAALAQLQTHQRGAEGG